MAEDVVSVAVEEGRTKAFCKGIGQVDRGTNMLEFEEIPFYPFTEGVVFYVHVSSAACWFTRMCQLSAEVEEELGSGRAPRLMIPAFIKHCVVA